MPEYAAFFYTTSEKSGLAQIKQRPSEKDAQRVRWSLSGNTCCIIPAGFICWNCLLPWLKACPKPWMLFSMRSMDSFIESILFCISLTSCEMAPTYPVISLIDLLISNISFTKSSAMTPAQTNNNACNDLLAILFIPTLFDQGCSGNFSRFSDARYSA